MSSLNLTEDFILQDIKVEPINSQELEELHAISGSYESLFNKRARLYKERGLKDKHLNEADFKQLILEHYTFLKRPVVLLGDKVFIGNSKATVQALVSEVNEK